MMIWIFHRLERLWTQFVRVAPNEIRVFLANIFSRQNEIILRGKSELPSSKLGKSQVFFNTFTDIRKYVAGVEAYIIYAPPPGANRVN